MLTHVQAVRMAVIRQHLDDAALRNPALAAVGYYARQLLLQRPQPRDAGIAEASIFRVNFGRIFR